MFKLFSLDGKTLTPTVPHPVNQSRKLFLLFDFVHILKSIRNNWLNLKDYHHTFTYPNPLIFPNYDDVNKIHIAFLANKVRNVNSIQREHLKSIQDRKVKKFEGS